MRDVVYVIHRVIVSICLALLGNAATSVEPAQVFLLCRPCYNLTVLRKISVALCALGLVPAAISQQASQQPPVKVNVLNVCAPSSADRQEIVTALSHIPKQPAFSNDFEVDRGRSPLDENPGFLPGGANTQVAHDTGTAAWVRIRHEFAGATMFSTVQYSFSVDPKSMVETLVFHVRDPKDLMQIAIEDSASAVTAPATMLSTGTPASRIKLERFGKSSIVLARCQGTENAPPPDQSVYEPLFNSASQVMEAYRGALAAQSTVPQELARIGSGAANRATSAASVRKNKTASTPPPK